MLVRMAEAIGRLVLAGRELTRLAGWGTGGVCNVHTHAVYVACSAFYISLARRLRVMAWKLLGLLSSLMSNTQLLIYQGQDVSIQRSLSTADKLVSSWQRPSGRNVLPLIDWLIVVYCSSVHFATSNKNNYEPLQHHAVLIVESVIFG